MRWNAAYPGAPGVLLPLGGGPLCCRFGCLSSEALISVAGESWTRPCALPATRRPSYHRTTEGGRTLTVRVRPGSLREIGLFAWAMARISGRVTGTNPPNLFLVLGKNRKLFRAWLRFAGRLMPGGVLPRRETERSEER